VLLVQRDLKKAQTEISKLENEVVEFKTKFDEMMEENDHVSTILNVCTIAVTVNVQLVHSQLMLSKTL